MSHLWWAGAGAFLTLNILGAFNPENRMRFFNAAVFAFLLAVMIWRGLFS